MNNLNLLALAHLDTVRSRLGLSPVALLAVILSAMSPAEIHELANTLAQTYGLERLS